MGGGRVEGLARRDEVHCSPATPLVRPATIDKEAAIVGCTGANIDCSRVEMSCSVDEIGCKPAIVLIIVKTLNCTRVIKGFYYDEKLCKLSEKLVAPAETLEPGRIALEPRLEPDAGGREAFRAQHQLLVSEFLPRHGFPLVVDTRRQCHGYIFNLETVVGRA